LWSNLSEKMKDTVDKVTSRDDVTPELIQQLNSRITNIIQTLFLSAISEKLVPMVQRLEYELECLFLTKEQVAQKRGKDISEDVFAV
jgi:hypothetical protein